MNIACLIGDMEMELKLIDWGLPVVPHKAVAEISKQETYRIG